MNPRVAAAMEELNRISWDQYLTPPKTQPLKKPDSLNESSVKSVESSTIPQQDYSGYVFKDISQDYADLRTSPELTSQVEEEESPDGNNEIQNVNDDGSDDSNEPVLAGEINEDDFGLDSPDSLSTKESLNDQEILAHNNAILNKEALHESFLLENNRLMLDSDQNSSTIVEGNIQLNASHSVEGDTKSVTFADEDSIYEFDRPDDRNFEEVYPDMDPNAIYTDDREEITRRYMVEAVREEFQRSSGNNNYVDESSFQNYEYSGHEDIVLSQTINEELECQIARERLDQLILSSPEFRSAILNFSGVSGHVANSPPHLPKNNTTKVVNKHLSRNRKNAHRAKPYADSSVADSAESRPSSRPKSALPNLSKSANYSMVSKRIGTGNSGLVEAADETVQLSRTANLEYIYRLASEGCRPSPSIEFAPPPPKLSTECPMLPFDGIMKLAELNLTGDSHCIFLHPAEERLRMKLKYHASMPDWEFSNRLDFFGLHFSRSEYMISSPLAPKNSVEGKMKLALSQDEVTNLLFTNRTKDTRKNLPHVFQLNNFVKETYTGFVCLVFDMKLQLLGTYDHKSKDYFPGLTICPPHLQTNRRKKRTIDTNLANLFEIDLNLLPLETFAIVPVLYDDSPHGAKFPEMTFQFDLSVREGQLPLRRQTPYWIAPDLDQPSDSTPIHELFEVDTDLSRLISQPSHVFDLDPGWTHTESYFCTRGTLIADDVELEGPPPISIDNATQSKMVSLGMKQSFIPCAIFRCLGKNSPGDSSNSDNRTTWGIKTVQETFSGIMFHTIVRGALGALKHKRILPYHVINVEHCMRCDRHSMTTWHVPGSYEKWFFDLKRQLRKSLPPAIITSNKFTNTLQNPPRVGSFELSIRPYSSDVTQLIFSKLSSRTLPPTETILRDLAILLLPETIKFKGSHILELHVYNSYSKRPVKGATIALYQIVAEVTLTEDIEKDALRENRDFDDFNDPENDEYDDKWTELKKNRHKLRIESAKRNGEVMQARISKHKSSTKGQKLPSTSSFSSQLAKSNDTTHANFRHSTIYFKVRSWKIEDITAWFRSFSIDKSVIDRAIADGLVDGPAFVVLANQQSFEKWGVRNKLKLERMNKSVEEILSTSERSFSGLNTDNDNMVSSHYDPFLDTGDLKVGEVKHSVPAKPKSHLHTDDINLKLVTKKLTDSNGLGFLSIDTCGTYFFRIESSVTAPYCSNSFQIHSAGHTGYCAAMKPRIGIAQITIKLNELSNVNDGVGFKAPTGILVSMMNLMSGKRHIAFAKLTSERLIKETTSQAKLPQLRHAPPRRAMTVDANRTSSSTTPPQLNRQNSVGSVLLNEMTNSWRGGSILVSGSMKTISEVETRVLEALIWLPVGKYFSEVSGEVFEVKEEASIPAAEKVHYWNIGESTDDDNSGNQPSMLSYSYKQAERCHRRILLGSIRAFQKIYRRYKKDFLTTNLWAYLALKRHLRRYLLYVRGVIQQRKSTKIGAVFRMYAARKAYRSNHSRILVLQCVIRKFLAKKKYKVLKRSRILVLRVISRYLVRMRRLRLRMAERIQCKYRQHLAILQRNRKLVQKRIFRSLKRWLKYNSRVRQHLEELEREKRERELMKEAEDYQVNYLKMYEAEERRKIREKILRVELKRNEMALIIQRNFRRYFHMQRYRRLSKGFSKFQKICRIRLHEDRIKQNLPLKYVIGFPMLLRYPQLLGGTKLLLGLQLTPPPPPSPKYIDQILLKLITPPAIKIQSVVRMYLVRLRYISEWRMRYQCDETFSPPLHRYLLPVPEPEINSEQDEVTHESDPESKYWNTGADALLNELGYVRYQPEVNEDQEYFETNQEDDIYQSTYSDKKSLSLDQINPRDRRVTRMEAQRMNFSATLIQSLIRGYLARKRCVRLRTAREEREKKKLEAHKSAQEKLKLVKKQSSVVQSLKSFSLGENFRSLSRSLSAPSEDKPVTSQKPLLRILSKEIVHAVDQSIQAVKVAGDTVATKYAEKTDQIKETKEKAKLELYRKDRLLQNEFCVEDGIFNIKGRPIEIPRLNRRWYLGVFPQLDEYEIDQETIGTEMLSGHDLEQAYEMLHDRIIGEAVRTPPLTPFSKETYEKLNFNIHLADLQRYTRLLVVIFVETTEELDGRIRTDALPSHIAIPSVRQKKNNEPPKFLPLFYGSCQLNGGLAYTPCGGRLLFHLQPNPNQAIIFSKSQAKRLSAIKHIELQGTLIPVAVPSSKFLASISDAKATLPYYPGELLDAFLFEKHEVQVKEFYGAAICMLRFSSRNLVSTRHRGVPNGIVEFSMDGQYLGKVIEYREDMGTVSTMTAGKNHFICCGSTGAVGVYAANEEIAKPSGSFQSISSSHHSVSLSSPFELLRFQVLHQWPILLSCSIHRAGLDFFFTIDRQNYIGVLIMENRTCLRSYINPPFVTAKISCCQLIRDRMYLGLQNGYLVTINTLPLMSGQLDCGKRLNEFVLDRESIYPEDCGITAISVMSGADYFGLLNEDLDHHVISASNENYTATNVKIKPRPKLIGMKLKKNQGSNSNESIYQKNSRLRPGRPLEGHILLIAGGDVNPTVKVLHPFHPKPATGSAFYQIGELPGHGKATTQIVCDLAGRFIVTCSQGAKSIYIWNGITFNCEKTHENVNTGYLGVSENSLFACSFKAPFVTIWKLPEVEQEKKPPKSYRRKIEPSLSNISDIFSQSNLDDVGEEDEENLEISRDGRPEIAMVRTSVWCVTTVTGGKIIPQKSLAPTTSQYLGDNGRRVVDDWYSFYNRSIKKITKPPPGKSTSNLKKSQSLPPIQEKSKRKELQRLASGSGVLGSDSIMSRNHGVGNIPTSVQEDEMSDQQFETKSQLDYQPSVQESIDPSASTSAYDWRTGYDYKHGCYYDEHGYAYNYDQNGNYFYYDASWYEQFASASPYQSYQSNSAPQSPYQPPVVNQQVEDPLGSTMTSDSYVTVPMPFSSQDEIQGVPESLRIGENSFQSPDSLRPSPTMDRSSPSPVEVSQSHTPILTEKSPKKSKKFLDDPNDYDRYGKYIGSDLDRYDLDIPSPSLHRRSLNDGLNSGSKHSLPVISLRRRHMHMSDSESDEEEKLNSIYRAKKDEKTKKGIKESRLSDEESEGDVGNKSVAESRVGSGRDGGREEEEEGEESVVSISKEKQKFLERERYIQRGLLHHLADDSDDED